MRIERCIIAPAGHPILKLRQPAAKDIARYPIVAYDERAQTGVLLNELFAKEGLKPKIVVKATDSDVVMSYVAAGIGIALLQKQIVRHEKRKGIRAIDISHLLPPAMTKLSFRRDAYLPRYMYDFIALVAPQWNREALEKLTSRGASSTHPTTGKNEDRIAPPAAANPPPLPRPGRGVTDGV